MNRGCTYDTDTYKHDLPEKADSGCRFLDCVAALSLPELSSSSSSSRPGVHACLTQACGSLTPQQSMMRLSSGLFVEERQGASPNRVALVW